MALVKGICKNYGECDLADNKEVQEVDKTNFVCEECGKPLHSLEGGKNGGVKVKPGLNKALIGIICAIAICLLAGAGIGAYFLFGKADTPTAINLDNTALTMAVGERSLIVPSVEPEGVKATFTFKANGNNVEVTNGGEVTALKKGETTIIVKCEENPEIRAICKVTVENKGSKPIDPVLVEKLTIDGSDFSLKEGESQQLVVAVAPEKHDEVLAWSSDDEAIAIVDATGKVTAVKAGSANIKITANQSGVSAVVKVTVTKKEGTGGGTGTGTGTGSGTYSLGWGTYSGPMSGGKPNGFGGTITVSRSYTIDLKKASGETVQVNAGDKITNVKMENGVLRQGEIHFANGTRRYLSGL